MKLKDLIGVLKDARVVGGVDAEVTGISLDSRSIGPEGAGRGRLFAALPGVHADGRRFIKDALLRGAAAILTEGELPADSVAAPVVVVKDARAALALLAAAFYGRPSDAMKCVGVTGTNGKTTITYLVESILSCAGLSPGVVGTVNYRYAGRVVPAPHTTPEAPDLQRLLGEMREAGVTHLVMEVSSHALAQKRAHGISFDSAVFTNLTREHLDYHGTMEEYYGAKAVLFRELLKDGPGRAVVNADDPYGRRLASEFGSPLTYGLSTAALIRPVSSEIGRDGTRALLDTPAGRMEISTPLVGEYNLMNVMAAVGASIAVGVEPRAIERGVRALARVPGRLDRVEVRGAKNFTAYVDYAHTGDALERALGAISRVASGRIITVFGCGGNRDRGKRPVMGEAAARLSDVAVITSDNPRDEDPLEIIREVEAGVGSSRRCSVEESPTGGGKFYFVIPDRREAIRKAVRLAGDGDTLLVAGKGHEDYQITGVRKEHFNDVEEIVAAAAELNCRTGVAHDERHDNAQSPV